MQHLVEIKPKKCPINLIKKDWSQRKCYYHASAVDFIEKVHDLEVYEDDVWLVTLPECGTWMQELLWLVMNDFDFETAKKEHLELRTPLMEFDFHLNENLETAFKPLENLKRPRIIKSHLCLSLLPAQIWDKNPKVVYVSQNIKDAFFADYYHSRYMGRSVNKSLDDYVKDQIEGVRNHEPFQSITEFYTLRNEPWLFYTSYERMKHDLRQVILDVCKFLNKSITDENLAKMLQHLSVEEMQMNTKTNRIWEHKQVSEKLGLPFEKHEFFRKGLMNVDKEELSPEMAGKLDKWVNENLTKYDLDMDELLLLNNNSK